MSEPFTGEIRLFAGNFEPSGWMICDGRLLPISEHMALFEVIGTTYGGDGRMTFALPDLRGRVVLGKGAGPGLTNRRLGESGGTEYIALTADQPAAHSDAVRPTSSLAADRAPQDRALSTGTTGSSAPIPNVPPFLILNFIIAVAGRSPRNGVRIIRGVNRDKDLA